MKKLTVVAVMTALILVSCQKDGNQKSADTRSVIDFFPYLEEASAGGMDVATSNPAEFKVMSYYQGTADGFFESELTVKQQASGCYTVDGIYFWPASGLDFFAYSGSGAGTITNTSGMASLTYTVPADGTEDFMVSKAENCTQDISTKTSDNNTQFLTFSHALTKINSVTLKANLDGVDNKSMYRFLFTDVSIVGAKNSATYTFNPTSGDNWTNACGSADYTFTENSGEFQGCAIKTLKCDETLDQFTILPQTATFSITYSVQNIKTDESTHKMEWTEMMGTTTKTVTVPMETEKAYDITFKLSNDDSPIICDVAETAWTETDPEIRYADHYVENGIDYGEGVEIRRLIWAPVNCGTSTKHPLGLIYQYGRCDGQGIDLDPEDHPKVVFGQTSKPEAGTYYAYFLRITESSGYWKRDGSWYNGTETFSEDWSATPTADGLGNPCPSGWRVPTSKELALLFFTDYKVYPSDDIPNRNKVVYGKLRTTVTYKKDGCDVGSGLYFPCTYAMNPGTGKANENYEILTWANASKLTLADEEHLIGYSDCLITQGNFTLIMGAAHSTGLSVRCVKDTVGW